MVLIRPAFQGRGRVEDVLDAMDHDRTVRILGYLNDALDPEQFRPVGGAQQVEKHFQRGGGDRPIGRQGKGADLVIMAVHVVPMMVVVMSMVMVPVMVVMPMIMVVRGLVGLGIQPFGDIGYFRLRIVEPGVEQAVWRCLAFLSVEQPCSRIEMGEPFLERAELFAGFLRLDQIGFGQDQPVCDGHLAAGFLVGVERFQAVDRIDQGYDAFQPVAHDQIGMQHDRVQNRRRIGEPGGLDDHPCQPVHAAVVEASQEIFQRCDQVATDRTAQAA